MTDEKKKRITNRNLTAYEDLFEKSVFFDAVVTHLDQAMKYLTFAWQAGLKRKLEVVFDEAYKKREDIYKALNKKKKALLND